MNEVKRLKAQATLTSQSVFQFLYVDNSHKTQRSAGSVAILERAVFLTLKLSEVQKGDIRHIQCMAGHFQHITYEHFCSKIYKYSDKHLYVTVLRQSGLGLASLLKHFLVFRAYWTWSADKGLWIYFILVYPARSFVASLFVAYFSSVSHTPSLNIKLVSLKHDLQV